jgi:hypothetical protein
MVDDENAPIGITAYARHRGCSSAAVHKAVRTGRLRGSVVRVQGRTMLRSAAAADREWEARTDRSRRPDYARGNSSSTDDTCAAPAPAAVVETDADEEGEVLTAAASSDPVLADYQREAMRERARKLKLENDEREGRLVDVERVRALAFEFARTVRENVFNVPGRVAAEVAAESDAGRVHLLLDAALREALHATADSIEGQPGGGDVSTVSKERV